MLSNNIFLYFSSNVYQKINCLLKKEKETRKCQRTISTQQLKLLGKVPGTCTGLHYLVLNFYQINGDGEIRTRDRLVIKALIPCQRTISTQQLKLLGEISGYDLYYSLTTKKKIQKRRGKETIQTRRVGKLILACFQKELEINRVPHCMLTLASQPHHSNVSYFYQTSLRNSISSILFHMFL